MALDGLASERPLIRRLVGVYNADGTVRGELGYLLAKARGRAPCALCDITHGWVRPKIGFLRAISSLPVAFDLVHADAATSEQNAAGGDRRPFVLADTTLGSILLLGPDEIDRCRGEVDTMMAAVRRRAMERGLAWPGAMTQA